MSGGSLGSVSARRSDEGGTSGTLVGEHWRPEGEGGRVEREGGREEEGGKGGRE